MRWLLSFIIMIIAIVLVGIFIMKKTGPIIQTITIKPKQPLKVISWIPYWDSENAFASYAEHIQKIDYISLFWYFVDSKGNIRQYSQASNATPFITYAHNNNKKIFGLIANLSDNSEKETWDTNVVHTVIGTPQAREKHIAAIVQIANDNNYDGIDIDYESLPENQKEDFSTFIHELAIALHANGKLLGVTIHPKTSENNPEENNGSHAQDLTSLANDADLLYFMTYLQHTVGSSPGPPGDITWIQSVMNYASDSLGLPKEKLFMGIGLMGVEWKITDNQTAGERSDIPFQDVLTLSQMYQVTSSWDDSSRTPYLQYQTDQTNHVIWFENNSSVMQRITLAKEIGVGGIAFWRLGHEDNDIWNNL